MTQENTQEKKPKFYLYITGIGEISSDKLPWMNPHLAKVINKLKKKIPVTQEEFDRVKASLSYEERVLIHRNKYGEEHYRVDAEKSEEVHRSLLQRYLGDGWFYGNERIMALETLKQGHGYTTFWGLVDIEEVEIWTEAFDNNIAPPLDPVDIEEMLELERKKVAADKKRRTEKDRERLEEQKAAIQEQIDKLS